MKNTIPRPEITKKQSLSKDVILDIFSFDTSLSLKEQKVPMAIDVALMVFHLAGINTADLYTLEKSNLKKGKLCYNRLKTKDRRGDKSYIEITVPIEIKHLLEKYKGKDRLFNFSERYYTHQQFNKSVNQGLEDISKKLGIDKMRLFIYNNIYYKYLKISSAYFRKTMFLWLFWHDFDTATSLKN